MRTGDLAAVGALSDSVHGRYTEPVHVYAERHRLYPEGCFVLDLGGMIAGYLVTHPWRRANPPPLGAMLGAIPADADSYYLHDLALLPVARGTGAGAAAARHALNRARAAGFAEIVLVAVGGAEGFWSSRGFRPVEDAVLAAKLRRDYGPEALYMRRPVMDRD
ncbi:MAG: GNAT family N-acetyltransferase [Sphingobium sp.]